MGQKASSIFEENQTPSARNSPCQYNTAKAIFVTNSQETASSLSHSSNMGQKPSSVQSRKEDTSCFQTLEEVTTRFKNFTFKEEEEEEEKEEETYHPRRYNNYTLGDAISVAQHKKAPTSRGLGSQRKMNFVNESFPSLPQSEKRKNYEKEEDAAPSLRYNFAAQSGIKISPISESTNTISPFYRSVTSSYKEEIKEGEKISQILRHLDQNLSPDNVIYGFWQCEKHHFPSPKEKLSPLQKYQNKNRFDWERENTITKFVCTEEEIFLGPLQKYQHETPKVLYNTFEKTCFDFDCRKKNMITSFRVYTRPQCFNEEPPTHEIICHLFWKDYYRVFGEFKCQNCRKRWKSAYIWISFRQFIKKTLGPQLCEDDFYMQKCKRCNGKSSILEYEPLQYSDGTSHHKEALCVKCQAGYHCTQTGTYLGQTIR